MEIGGWIMLGASWVALSTLVCFCLTRVFQGPKD